MEGRAAYVGMCLGNRAQASDCSGPVRFNQPPPLFGGHRQSNANGSHSFTFEIGPGNQATCDIGKDVKILCKEGRLQEALQFLDRMDQRDINACWDAYVGLLQGCIQMKALPEGKRVHAHIIKTGFGLNIFLGNTLINMYAKCGSIADAHRVFDGMPERNVFTWTMMIAGYAKYGYAEEALKLFWLMEREGVKPDKVAFLSILNACATLRNLEHSKRIHDHIVKSGYESDVFVRNSLVDMYVKCGSLELARQVFEKFSRRDVVLWNVMIAGYAKNGYGEKSFELFQEMEQYGLKPDRLTFVSILKACTNLGALERGKQVHAHIIKRGFESDVLVGNSIVDMYAKCGSIDTARKVFDKMTKRDVISWNAMIGGYGKHGYAEEALLLFQEMEQEGVKPNAVTFVSILNACASLGALEQGKQIHAGIIKIGLESDVFVGNSLIDMYAKCGSLERACEVFGKMHVRDVVSWNAMITGYANHEHGEEALKLFWQMEGQGLKPDEVTFVSALKACGTLEALEQGKQIHAHIIKLGIESDVFVGNSIVGMYAQCGSIKHARQVFDKMPKRDVVSWTTMISGYAKHGHDERALFFFQQMERTGVHPDATTFVSVLKACASLAALKQGKQIHARIIEHGFESDIFVGNALVDMYAKCGSIEHARQVFDNMPNRDVVSWTAMIAGYAQHGHGKEVMLLAEEMRREGIKLSHITFVSVLSACSHAGLVDEGCHYFHSMSRDHGITPTAEHYACMVDLLSRAGNLEEAEDFVGKIPFQPCAVVWTTLLNACRIHGNVELAERAAAHVLELEPRNAAAFVLLSNIYAAAGRWDDKAKVMKLMMARGVIKQSECSSIEKNRVQEFIVDYTSHPQFKEIHKELERLCGQILEGECVSNVRFVLNNVEEQ